MARAGWIAALSVGAVMVGGVAVYAQSGSDPTTVERVIDGDTVDVRIDGETERIRLLNVDTPETKHPEKEIECLGPEATDFLKEQLPAGHEIELEFDEERTDRYGRVLAGIFKDDELINAEIARAGLGVAASFEPNTRFYPEVKSAQDEAESQGLGLFDESQDCAIAALMSAAEEQVAALPEELADDVSGIEEQLLVILAAAEAVSAAQASLDVFAEFPNAGISRGFSDRSEELKKTLRTHADKLEGLETDAEERIDSIKEEERLEEERLEEERLEEERLEEEREEAERQAEEREAERAAEREAERQRQAEQNPAPQPQPAPTTQPAPEPSPQPTQAPQPAPEKTKAPQPPAPAPSRSNRNEGGGGGTPNLGPEERPPGAFGKNEAPPGYTGPRCFLPGGKWWNPC